MIADENFIRVFKNNLKINMRSISVKTLLGERNIKRINYKPYYQRNYVWDNKKASFFIESVLLGTDIPPLILFKSGRTIEVIDGRQRFETLMRFKESSFKLSANGLMELKSLKGRNFNDLSEEIKGAFLDTKVRLFEFEVVNEPALDPVLEDKIKKEIFRRYNTGITPITGNELDNAKYDEDNVTSSIKALLKQDNMFYENLTDCFFKKKKNNNGISESNVTDFFRRFITLSHFPIRSYADSGRTDTRELLYDFIASEVEDSDSFILEFKEHLDKIILIFNALKSKNASFIDNKLIFECLLWADTILSMEGVKLQVNDDLVSKINEHYSSSIDKYDSEGSHFYGSIIVRFSDTAEFFENLFSINLNMYIKNENFKGTIKELKQTEGESLDKISALKALRLLKPEPSSEPFEEILSDLNTYKYLLRPSYQRQEKISIYKASSIIESILLGIYLPPIFIYKNEDGIKEVIDGQQRLLSVLGFLGRTYLDEKGIENHSKNNNFSLKGLRILTEFNGRKFSSLPEEYQEKIYDFDLNIIEIDSKLNKEFEPVDLFIRLNNKPYPIKENSFEMWNSTVNKSIIQKIKNLSSDMNSWFYLRVVNKTTSRDRMENEEMIAVLSYLDYISLHDSETSGVEFYLKTDRLNCRIGNKAGVTLFLNSLDASSSKSKVYIESIENIADFISKIETLLIGFDSKQEGFNKLLNVKLTKSYTRTLQDIYLLWLCFSRVSQETIISEKDALWTGFQFLLKKLKNTDEDEVNLEYMKSFENQLSNFVEKYGD
ncbi:DUF262 domain-containing protein [Shewanella japonica]|uniref:DUF262 domain-containing protein n=1 Tax=Shewanella japonica TaxID=93973 RepID=UPI00249461B3|nr:DUF262 domain-containing protein [Shewanella japonica]